MIISVFLGLKIEKGKKSEDKSPVKWVADSDISFHCDGHGKVDTSGHTHLAQR